MAKAVQRIVAERGFDSIEGEENRSHRSKLCPRVKINEILGHNTISINDYNLMDAMQKSILIEQNYVIIRMLNEMPKK